MADHIDDKAGKFLRRPPATIDLPGQLATDGFSEVFEMLIEDLSPFGLEATGLPLIKGILKKAGLDNSYVVHAADMATRTGLRLAFNDKPILREMLIGISDAYFDKLKSLPDKPNQEQMQKAKAEGQKSASAKMREFIAKKNAKPSFEKLFEQLDPAERQEYAKWMRILMVKQTEQSKEWKVLRERIGSVTILKAVLATRHVPKPGEPPATDADDTAARILFLEGLYGTRPSAIDVVMAIANGESTPHTQALQEKAEGVLADRKAKAKDAAASLAQTKKRYRW